MPLPTITSHISHAHLHAIITPSSPVPPCGTHTKPSLLIASCTDSSTAPHHITASQYSVFVSHCNHYCAVTSLPLALNTQLHLTRRTTMWYALQAHDHSRATGSPLSSFEATMQLDVTHLISHTASSTHMLHPRYLSSATSLRAPASYHHLIRTAGLPCTYSQD